MRSSCAWSSMRRCSCAGVIGAPCAWPTSCGDGTSSSAQRGEDARLAKPTALPGSRNSGRGGGKRRLGGRAPSRRLRPHPAASRAASHGSASATPASNRLKACRQRVPDRRSRRCAARTAGREQAGRNGASTSRHGGIIDKRVGDHDALEFRDAEQRRGIERGRIALRECDARLRDRRAPRTRSAVVSISCEMSTP